MFIFHFLHGNRNRVVQHCYMELRRIVWLRWHALQWFCIVASIVVGHLVSRAGWFHLKVGRKEFSIINQSLNQSVYQSINQSVSQTNNFCFGHSAGPLLLQYRNSGFSDVTCQVGAHISNTVNLTWCKIPQNWQFGLKLLKLLHYASQVHTSTKYHS